MTIIGLGLDITRISRIRSSFEKWGDRWLARVLHQGEIEKFKREKNPDRAFEFLAGRWAAKEAVFKAFGSEKLPFVSIYVTSFQPSVFSYKPGIVFEGPALKAAKRIGVDKSHLSIAHEGDYVIATAILESNSSLPLSPLPLPPPSSSSSLSSSSTTNTQ